MTPQEAIKQLEYDREMCLFNPSTGEEEPMNDDCRKTAEALGLAIEALEDKIPRKIEKQVDMFDTSYKLYCPACGTYFGTRGKHSIWIGSKPAYCDCGQRLDWSDVDDNPAK